MTKLIKAQYLTLSDVCREAAAVVLGGLVIGGIVAQQFKLKLLLIGFILYPILVALALYFKRKGE
jgi:hypothetical protein